MKKIFKVLLLILSTVFVLLAIILIYLFVGSAPQQKNITWGIDFSQMQAEALNLNWKEAYLAMLDDLNVKNIKLHTQWDWIEGDQGHYFFDDTDWQLDQAQKHNAKIIYVVGIKTGRWPECHIPAWANNLSGQQTEDTALKYVTEVVLRYKDNKAIAFWQAENEPFITFGGCPSWYYQNDDFLKKEVALIKSIDPSRQVIVSDSGELSSWTGAAQIGDILGTTMYREAWVNLLSFGLPVTVPGFYESYPLPPVFYSRKAEMIKYLFGKKVICVELQAEPWAQKPFYDVSLEEQAKTMSLGQFKSNIEYAKKTGLDTFYLWGDEWWYWMKTVKNQPAIWNEAKTLFNK